jgi:hypothetical protein
MESDKTIQTGGALKAVNHLKDAVARGTHWYIALLEAIKLWDLPEERYRSREYLYLIDGEAFDWLLLAERLLDEIKEIVPENEKIDLLFFDRPPLDISKEEFKQLIGPAKYKAYLNYTYGVLVEEALIYAVVDDIRKDRRSQGSSKDEGVLDRAYQRIYGSTEQELFREFRKEKGNSRRTTVSISESKEFLYWLFKYRIKRTEKDVVASDTKKALAYLQRATASAKKRA